MQRHLVSIIITIALLISLAGCALKAPADDALKGGTLYIQVNPEIAVTYDASGTVTSVTAVTEDAEQIVAQYQDFAGKACTDVVVDLVTMIGEAGYLSDDSGEVTISISFDDGSSMPSEDFTASVEQQIQTVVEDRQWQGTVTVAPPPESSGEKEPSDTSLPGDAVMQEDGTYLHTEYLDKSDKPVEQDDPNAKYVLKTVYDSQGRMTEQTKEHLTYHLVLAGDWWEYSQDGKLLSYVMQRRGNDGIVTEHYREEYDADGRLALTTVYSYDGTVDSLVTYEYHSNGKRKTETETNESGTVLAFKEYSEGGVLVRDCAYFRSGGERSQIVYSKDGIIQESSSWYEDGTLCLQEEYFANGYPKSHKLWYEDGTLHREFTAYTDENNMNGLSVEYDRSGNLLFRDSMGNPDGSYDTQEFWDEEGVHYLFAFSGEQLMEERYTYTDGSTLVITYDHDAGTKHTVRPGVDLISTIAADKPIEGYTEYSPEEGCYTRTEWKDGYKYKEISDGWSNFNGYKCRVTTIYYSNGQVKSSERYFYADGGREYAEFDENGNETFREDTTRCND